jgi:uncharacterized membrane protein (UPF0136 family)
MDPSRSVDKQTRPTSAPYASTLSTSVIPAWCMSGLCAAMLPFNGRPALALPSTMQLLGFTTMFGIAGYAIQQGDPDNGAGIATAWSLTYLFLNARKAWQTPRPAPLLLASVALGNLYAYGGRTLDQWLD